MTPRWRGPGRRQGRHATITFGYQPKASGKGTGGPSWPAPGFKGLRLTAGRRPKGDYVGPIRSPRLDRSRRYVGLMLALCWPMSALRWPYVGLSWPYLAPMLALCWPKLVLSCPYVGLCWPYVGPAWGRTMLKHLQHDIFSVPGHPLIEPQNHVKRVVFWWHQDEIPEPRRARNTVKHDVFEHHEQNTL